jgi:DNA processing protein
LTMLGTHTDFGRAMPPTDPDERTLIDALSREPRHIDDIVRASGLAAATVSGTLALLELKGLVRDLGGMQYVRVREDAMPYDAGTPGSDH